MGALDAIRPPHHPRVRRPDGPPRAKNFNGVLARSIELINAIISLDIC